MVRLSVFVFGQDKMRQCAAGDSPELNKFTTLYDQAGRLDDGPSAELDRAAGRGRHSTGLLQPRLARQLLQSGDSTRNATSSSGQPQWACRSARRPVHCSQVRARHPRFIILQRVCVVLDPEARDVLRRPPRPRQRL